MMLFARITRHYLQRYNVVSQAKVRAVPAFSSMAYKKRLLPLDKTNDDFDDANNNGDDDDDGALDDDDMDIDLDDDDDSKHLEPYKSLLQMPARASWRMTPTSPPKALEHAQKQTLAAISISSTRRKQTHPTLLRMIEAQQALRDRRERERRRVFQNKPYSKEDEEHDKKSSPTLVYGPDQAVASVKYRLYPQYSMVKRVLLESQSLVPSFQPTRVLDFGAGCGSAAAAAWDVFGRSSSTTLPPRQQLEWLHLIDASKAMRDVSEMFLKELVDYREEGEEEGASAQQQQRTPPRITTSAHMSTDSDNVFDLCISSFTLAELPDTGSILAAAALLYEKLRPGGLMVILEPGTPDGFANIRMVRNMILDCCPEESEDACQIIAPCTHHGKCPIERNYGNRKERRAASKSRNLKMEKMQQNYGENVDNDSQDDDEEEKMQQNDGENEDNDSQDDDDDDDDVNGTRIGFCSFVQTMSGGTTRRRGEKLSYLVVQKRSRMEDTTSQQDKWETVDFPDHLRRRLSVTSPDQPMHPLLQKEVEDLRALYLDSDEDELGLELLRGESNRSSFGRIIQAPKKRKGHVIIECCVNGRIEKHKIAKSLSGPAPGLYSAARKSRWGGYWVPTEPTESR